MLNDDLFTASLTFRQFDEIFREQLELIPENFKEGVAQFILEAREHRHSRYMPGIYTLGHYMPRGHIGQPIVVLYFGSFKKAFPHLQVPRLRAEVAKTLAHELLHHWELRSGYDHLGDEDREFLEEWKRKTSFKSGQNAVGKNFVEAALYIYFVFVLIAVIARWIGVAL
ncbi:MAG: hypothetical protein ACOYXC_01280 [Candidatus Rifleibacteriota bacterium]